MQIDSFNYRTPASQLVQVATLAAQFRGRPDQLNLVATETQKIVSVFSYDVINVIAREMGLSINEVYNFVTFYAMLSTRPHGRYTVRLCKNVSCHVNGAADVVRAIEDQLGIRVGQTTEDGMFSLEYTSCLGLCESAPAMMINRRVYGSLTPESARAILKAYLRGEVTE